MKLLFIVGKDLVTAPDHIVNTLAADAALRCHLRTGVIIENHVLINALLMLCEKLTIEIIEQSSFYKFFHLESPLLS